MTDLRNRLGAEFVRRRRANARYSLRAFARDLRTHHSALSRILRAGSRLSDARIHSLGRALGLTPAEIAVSLLSERMRRVLAIARHPRFRADSRWIAALTGLRLDDVNVALHYLIFQRRLALVSPTLWTSEQPS